MAMTGLLLLSLSAHAESDAAAKDAMSVPAPKPYALIQSWITLHDQDVDPLVDPAGYGDPEDDPGFKLRRVRLGLEGADDTLSYGVVVGVSSPEHARETFDAIRRHLPAAPAVKR